MTSRLFRIIETFIVPIAAGTAGFASGLPIAGEVGAVLVAFVPGVSALERWTVARSAGDREVSLSLALVLAGVALIAAAALVDGVLAQFLGKCRWTMIVRKASATFLFGVAMRAFVASWAPLRDGMAAFESPVAPGEFVDTSQRLDLTPAPVSDVPLTPPKFTGPVPDISQPSPAPPKPIIAPIVPLPSPGTGPAPLTPIPTPSPTPAPRRKLTGGLL